MPTLSVAAPRPSTRAEAAPKRSRGRPPRTDSQRAAHRTRLIEAAMEAVRANGPDVSIDEMADTAGVSKPVLYAEFGDKLGLIDAIALVLAERVERTVVARITRDRAFDADSVIGAIVDALITLIDGEPQLYAFLARGLRGSDRGFLDNALVRVIHERAALVVGLLAPQVPKDELSILTDGVFGFVFGVVESWVATRRPPKEQLIEMMTAAIQAGLTEVASRRAAGSG